MMHGTMYVKFCTVLAIYYLVTWFVAVSQCWV